MKCLEPFLVKSYDCETGSYNRYYVGCGKCYQCLKSRRQQWLLRLCYQSLYSQLTLFITLTYDDEHLPELVSKNVLQKFVKDLRNDNLSFKYYGIGEYGSKNNRPHYHIVLFFNENHQINNLREKISKRWNNGQIHYLIPQSAGLLNYVLHYHINPKSVDGKSTFQIFSKGLGLYFIETSQMQKFVKQQKNIVTLPDGTKSVIPRYYRKKLGQLNTDVANKNMLDKFFFDCTGKHLYEVSPNYIKKWYDNLNYLYDVKIAKSQKKQKV